VPNLEAGTAGFPSHAIDNRRPRSYFDPVIITTNLITMKTTALRFAIAALSTTAALNAAHAQETRFYIRGDVGGTWSPDAELKEFFGSTGGGRSVEFDPGARFGIAGGYQLTDWFAPEIQTGFMAAGIHSITDADRVDAVFSQAPLLGNLRFQWPTQCRFTPYAGGGAGVSFSTLAVDDIVLDGTRIDGSEVDAVFAYQAFGGIRYQLNDRMGLSLEYRYFASCAPEWEADNLPGEIRFGEIETHSVSIAFDFKF